MTSTVATALTLITITHLSLSAYLMHQAGMLFNRSDTSDHPKLVKGGFKGLLPYLKFGVVCFLHNLDMFSDILYVLTVPCYHISIQILIVIFMLPPVVISIYFWFLDGDLKLILLTFFGVFPIYKIYNGEDDIEQLSEEVAGQGVLFILEDGP